MLSAAVLAQVAKPSVYLTDRLGKPDLEKVFPRTFGDWRIDTTLPVILPSPDVQAKLDALYNQVLSRTYVNRAGQRIMLSVAYGGDQSDGTRIHRPEVCYPAQGFQITFNQRSELRIGDRVLPVRHLMATLGSRLEPITYWLAVGGKAVASGSEQKLVELRYGLRGLIVDGMLVRISSLDADMQRGYELQASFAADLAAAMPPQSRDRVFGVAIGKPDLG
jgi:EpsI family protein